MKAITEHVKKVIDPEIKKLVKGPSAIVAAGDKKNFEVQWDQFKVSFKTVTDKMAEIKMAIDGNFRGKGKKSVEEQNKIADGMTGGSKKTRSKRKSKKRRTRKR